MVLLLVELRHIMLLQPLVEVLTVTSEGKRNGLVVGKESVRCYACMVCMFLLLTAADTHLLSLSCVFVHITGAFAVWGLCFASFDCSIAAVRKKVRGLSESSWW